MTYFDPQTYNWEELTDDDAAFMAGYNYCIQEAVSEVRLMHEHCELDFIPSLNKYIEEIFNNIAEELQDYLERHRVMITASFMDGNDKYCEE